MPHGASTSLVVRKLNTSRRLLCAAPDYLKRRGTPQTPEDLTAHDCLSYSYVARPEEWHLIGPDGERVVKVSGPIVTSHRHVLRAAAVRGLGIAYGPADFFRDDLKTGKLSPVLTDYELPEATIYAVYPGEPAAFRQSEGVQRIHGALFRGQSGLSLTSARGATANGARVCSPAATPRHRPRFCQAETPDRKPCG